jgi:hypothetical protein
MSNEPVTTDEFDVIFQALSPDQLKVSIMFILRIRCLNCFQKWTSLSAERTSAKKAAKAQAVSAANGQV